MRKLFYYAVLAIFAMLFSNCSGGRLSEDQFIAQATEMLSKGNIEDAIYSFTNLVKYYPESPRIEEYRAKLLELTLQAADKFEGTRKAETYFAEAIRLADESSDTIAFWVKFKMAMKYEKTDAEAAKKLYSQFPVEGFYKAAQVALGKGDYPTSIEAYKKIVELFPDDPGTYKALFLVGFGYSEYLNDYDNARIYFKRILDEYPECDLAPSADWMLKNMGKSPEEIEFLQNETAQKKA